MTQVTRLRKKFVPMYSSPAIQQNWYWLKHEYFVGVPANEISAISPISTMNDGQWHELVDKWSSPHHKVFSLGVLSNMYL